MNRTKRAAAIGLLCIGTSALSFGETFGSVGTGDWNTTYNANTALFGAVIQQDGASLQQGFPTTGTGITGGDFTSNATEVFTLLYDPSSGLAGLTVESDSTHVLDSITGVQTLKIAPAGGTLDHIGIALSTGNSDQIITIGDIALNGGSPGTDVLTSNGQQGLFDFAMTPATDFSGEPFTISGNINMTWTDGAPGAQLSAEIVGADTVGPPMPEPGTWALLGSALAGLGLLRRKRIV